MLEAATTTASGRGEKEPVQLLLVILFLLLPSHLDVDDVVRVLPRVAVLFPSSKTGVQWRLRWPLSEPDALEGRSLPPHEELITVFS